MLLFLSFYCFDVGSERTFWCLFGFFGGGINGFNLKSVVRVVLVELDS